MLHPTFRGQSRDRARAPLAAAVCAALSGAALAASTTAGGAATAHNSQAGAYGPNSHQCAPTPYFEAGGCASAALLDDRRYPFQVPATPPRLDRRSPYRAAPADAFDD